MSTKIWKHSLWGALAVLAVGCGEPAGEGEVVKGRAAFMQVSHQAVDAQDKQGGGGDDGGGPAPACSLVVYPPQAVWSSYSYQVRGYAYVSCPTWVQNIQITVGVEDSDEMIRVRRVSCGDTAMCAVGVNTLYPVGEWKTLAAANARSWGDYRESSWVSFSH